MTINKSTSHDVAKAAGVSVGTVIRVLNDAPKVSQELRDRVMRVVEELGYVYVSKKKAIDEEAQVEQTGHQLKNVMFCVPFDFDDPMQNGYFYPILRGASRECTRQGLNLVYTLLKDSLESLAQVKNMLRQGNLAGLLLINYGSQELIAEITNLKVPAIIIDPRQIEGLQVDFVTSDVFNGVKMAIDHLRKLGHERIAFINGAPRYGMQRRFEGYCAALAEAEIPLRPELVVVAEDGLPGSGRAALQKLLQQPLKFSAVLCAQDRLAFEVISALNQSGLRVPHDINVVGIDNHDASEVFSPPLTSVDVYAEHKGILAVRRLLERALYPNDPPTWSLLQTHLVVRASSASVAELIANGAEKATPLYKISNY